MRVEGRERGHSPMSYEKSYEALPHKDPDQCRSFRAAEDAGFYLSCDRKSLKKRTEL